MKRRLAFLLLFPSLAAESQALRVYEHQFNQWWEGPATSTVVSLDGALALAMTWGQPLRLLSLETGKEAPSLVRGGINFAAEDGVFCGAGNFLLLGKRGRDRSWFFSSRTSFRRLPLPAEARPQCAPDGDRIAYWSPDNTNGLFVAPMRDGATGTFERYAAAGRVASAAFSTDGRFLYASVFKADGTSELIRIVPGKPGVSLVADGLDAVPPIINSPIAVAPDGHTVYIALVSDGKPDNEARHKPAAKRFLKIYGIDANTGVRRLVSESAGQDNFAPTIAGGYLYWSRNLYHSSVAVMPVSGGEADEIVDGGEEPRWSPDGRRISYLFGGWRLADWALNLDVAAIGMDAQGHRTTEPKVIVSGYHEDFSAAWSPDGRWLAIHSHRTKSPVPIYDSPGSTDDIYLRRADDEGAPELRLTDFGQEAGPASWSPDGKKLLFNSEVKGGAAGVSKLWLLTLDRQTGRVMDTKKLPLPKEIRSARRAAWSPDGKEIAIEDDHGGIEQQIWIVDARDFRGTKLLTFNGTTEDGLCWTADGKGLIYGGLAGKRTQLFAVSRAGGSPGQLSHDSGNLMHPSLSPDGRWIACTRIVQSREIWRIPLP